VHGHNERGIRSHAADTRSRASSIYFVDGVDHVHSDVHQHDDFVSRRGGGVYEAICSGVGDWIHDCLADGVDYRADASQVCVEDHAMMRVEHKVELACLL